MSKALEIFDREGISPQSVLKAISEDAQRVGAAWFGMMRPGHGELTFHLRESKPTARAQAALDELEAAGLIEKRPFNQYGGIVYTPKWNFESLLKKATRQLLNGELKDEFRLMEPIEAPHD